MTALFTKELKQVIENSYNIGIIIACKRLKGGYWNDVIKISTHDEKYVLRISHPKTMKESLEYEHDLMNWMNERISEVPTPIKLNNSATYFLHKGRFISLFPFMPGSVPQTKNKPIRTAAANMLAKLHLTALEISPIIRNPGHESIADLDWNDNQMWSWEKIKSLLTNPAISGYDEDLLEIIDHRDVIIKQREQLFEWTHHLRRSNRQLLFAPTHGDFYKGNLLFMDDKITAVIDWDESKPDWLSFELARATWEFCSDKIHHTLNQAYAIEFLKTYKEAGGPVPIEEFDLLLPFIRCVRMIEILFSLQLAVDGENWEPEYTKHNLKSLIHLSRLNDVLLTEEYMKKIGKD